jgi:PrtD family type I secretion system ABC transporter
MSAVKRTHGARQECSLVSQALWANSRTLALIGGVSAVINLLMLTGSVFMIQIYDRVLVSRSLPTLAVLSAMAVGAYLLQGGLDAIRGRVLTLIGERIDASIGKTLYRAVMEVPLRAARGGQESLQPFRDLEAVRSFMAGPGPAAFFDLPWLPVYLLFCYLFHPLLGYAAGGAALLLLGITALADLRGASPARRAADAQSRRNLMADNAQRGAEAVRAMGVAPALAERWNEAHLEHLAAQRRAGFVIGGLSAIARMARMVAQSCMLGLGAYLAILGEISGGTIIAVSILASRALAPVDQAIASWRGFVAARQGFRRLSLALGAGDATDDGFAMPPPRLSLSTEGLFVAAPGGAKPILRNVGFRLGAGQCLGVIGSSASGKSTLARALVGVWTPLAGKVMLDGADIAHWSPDRLGPHIGYLPQDVQLLDGTIAENIARFERPLDSDAVISAASAAGFHQRILALPEGYETRIGAGGMELSAGQRQRLGLARALYRDPFLVVLDEPNANLDSEGESALMAAINGIGARGGIAVVITHRLSVMNAVSLVAVMRAGELTAFGPRNAILAQQTRPRAVAAGSQVRDLRAAGTSGTEA